MMSTTKRDALSTVNNNNNNNGNGFKRGGNCALAFDDDVDKEEESLLVLENRKRKSVSWEDEDKIIIKNHQHQHQRKLKNMRCDVEVRLKRDSTAKKSEVKERVLEYFERLGMPTVRDEEISLDDPREEEDIFAEELGTLCGDFVEVLAFLRNNCEKIVTYWDASGECEGMQLMFCEVDFRIHVHEINEDGAGEEREDDEEIATYKEYALPCREFSEYWDSLYLDEGKKLRLKNYARTALEFGNLNVNASLVAFNRVVLLHGPPGTGKTTMCKGLAQKLAIQMLDTYSEPVFVEINAHSLFSKWFSESGKLVSKLFEKIQELTDDEDTFVFVLVDEVESLAAARKATGAEPSDAIRVVNALLTQLDALKEKKNAMVLTTSNVTDAIDVAFIDRADVKMYVGNPADAARGHILLSSINELKRVGILPPTKLEMALTFYGNNLFKDVVIATEGMSGRALRKLPFLTIAGMNRSMCDGPINDEEFLRAVREQAMNEKRERERLGANN
jgi:pachytene checkpoint protein 2